PGLGQIGFGQQTLQQAASQVFLMPLPRFNAILVGAPKARLGFVLGEIEKQDKMNYAGAGTTPFHLEQQPASRVAAELTAFYQTRYGNDQNQVRITSDDATNTVLVQAAPADLAEIAKLIELIDRNLPKVNFQLRIVQLNNAVADELAALLNRAIAEG